ncbi:MAG: hypothetical protein C4538_04955 [Nitrospiraceae bacterium]|nr:MAG: hypothetical protein C4538_04955 [Nitrospiraceae bacterium]
MTNKLIKISGILGVILGIAAVSSVSMYPAKPLLNGFIAVLSLIFLLVFFIFHYESFKAFSKKRSTQLGLNSIMMIVFFIFIIVVLNLISRQYYGRHDMSSTSKFSLAPQTMNVVRDLKSEITVTVFGQESSPTFMRAMELLEGYRYLNRSFIYSIVDLDRTPLLAKQYGITQYDSIVVTAEGKTVLTQGISEEALTNAIIRATREGKNKVYFIAGHGEKDPKDSGRGGMSKAAQRLLAIGYDVSPLTLSSMESVPDAAEVLIIAGPSERFSASDIRKLQTFLSEGGRVLAMFDPGYDASDIISATGMMVRNAVIIDKKSNLGGKDENIPLVAEYPDTPVTRDFKLTTVFPGAAPLEIGGRGMDYDYLSIITSSPESMLIENNKISPEKGGHIIAASAGTKHGKDVVLLYGDSDFASNAFFDAVGNGNLFINSVNWLAEEGDLISIMPRKDDFVPLYLTSEQAGIISYISAGAIPLSIFGAGIFIWWRRKRF